MLRSSRHLLIPGLALGVLVLTAVLLASFVGAQQVDSPVPPGGERAAPTNPNISNFDEEILGLQQGSLLRTTNRTQLSLCVEGAGGFSVSAADVELVRQALAEALALVQSLPAEYGQRTAGAGCPPPTALIGRPIEDDESDLGGVRVGFGTDRLPSPHRLFVYFVSARAYADTFGTRAYFRVLAEAICHIDACNAVTSALYVPQSISSQALREGLIDGLSLRPLLQQQ